MHARLVLCGEHFLLSSARNALKTTHIIRRVHSCHYAFCMHLDLKIWPHITRVGMRKVVMALITDALTGELVNIGLSALHNVRWHINEAFIEKMGMPNSSVTSTCHLHSFR